jgi:transposase
MPRPIPVPVRLAAFRLWELQQSTHQIAESLDLSLVSVRRLVRRFRARGRDGLIPDYPRDRPDPVDSDIGRALLALRREHPTWGAELIRVHLCQKFGGDAVRATRTLQRWLLKADLAPAPSGRRPRPNSARATQPHQTWQMDAKERIEICSKQQVSWLRLIDECSGAVLSTVVFPPR